MWVPEDLSSHSISGGTQSSKSVWVDNSATSGSCAAEMKTAIEFEEKNKDEDGASIQEGEDVEMSVCNWCISRFRTLGVLCIWEVKAQWIIMHLITVATRVHQYYESY